MSVLGGMIKSLVMTAAVTYGVASGVNGEPRTRPEGLPRVAAHVSPANLGPIARNAPAPPEAATATFDQRPLAPTTVPERGAQSEGAAESEWLAQSECVGESADVAEFDRIGEPGRPAEAGEAPEFMLSQCEPEPDSHGDIQSEGEVQGDLAGAMLVDSAAEATAPAPRVIRAAATIERIAGNRRPMPASAAGVSQSAAESWPECESPAAGGGNSPCASPPSGPAAHCVSIPRPEDEVWLISSRGLGCGGITGEPALRYWRYNGPQGWIATPAEQFWSTLAPQTPLNIAVHGNRMSQSDAVGFGWNVYSAAVRNNASQPAMRFVIWSWPSQRVPGGPANDARVKAARADVDARFLAWFVDRLLPETPLGLAGYSFGARVIGGALQLLAGGALNGYAMPARDVGRTPRSARVVFLAAAIDNDWLLPDRRYGMAMGQIEHLSLINNSCDRVLRLYHCMYCRHGGPQALGCVGQAASSWLGADREKIEQRDVCCMIGPRHDWERYEMNGSIGLWISQGLAPAASAAEHAGPPVQAKLPVPARSPGVSTSKAASRATARKRASANKLTA